jgi:hypothetical protein
VGHLWAILFGERPHQPDAAQVLLAIVLQQVVAQFRTREGQQLNRGRYAARVLLRLRVENKSFSTSAKREGGMGFAGGGSLLI